MKELPKTKDTILGAGTAQKLSNGPYTEVIGKALGEVPATLLQIQAFCLPLGKRFKPIKEKDQTHGLETVSSLPKEVKKFLAWAEENFTNSSEDPRVILTEAAVTWC